MQQTTLLFCIISTSFLVGCEKLSFNSAKCNSEDTRKLVIELINKDIDQLTSEQVKTLINTQNITLDMGKVRSTIKQFDIKDLLERQPIVIQNKLISKQIQNITV